MNISQSVGCSIPELKGDPTPELVNSDVCLGVEIELENARVDYISGWYTVDEGSLRGRFGKEYIFRRPYNGTDVIEALTLLESTFTGTHKPVLSKDASVHVHVDVSNLELPDTARFIMASVLFEPILLYVFCNNRINNPFCQNTLSNPEILNSMLFCMRENFCAAPPARYASINLASIPRWGSVEFRSHPAAYTKDAILPWINALLSVYTFATQVHTPPHRALKGISVRQALMSVFSTDGMLPEWAESLLDDTRTCNKLFNIGMRNSRSLYSDVKDIKWREKNRSKESIPQPAAEEGEITWTVSDANEDTQRSEDMRRLMARYGVSPNTATVSQRRSNASVIFDEIFPDTRTSTDS